MASAIFKNHFRAVERTVEDVAVIEQTAFATIVDNMIEAVSDRRPCTRPESDDSIFEVNSCDPKYPLVRF